MGSQSQEPVLIKTLTCTHEDLVKMLTDSVVLGWGPRFCIFHELPDEAAAAAPRTTLGEPRVRTAVSFILFL